jgi:hypothetical protein
LQFLAVVLLIVLLAITLSRIVRRFFARSHCGTRVIIQGYKIAHTLDRSMDACQRLLKMLISSGASANSCHHKFCPAANFFTHALSPAMCNESKRLRGRSYLPM